jgi:hypothetical protein
MAKNGKLESFMIILSHHAQIQMHADTLALVIMALLLGSIGVRITLGNLKAIGGVAICALCTTLVLTILEVVTKISPTGIKYR